MLAFIGSGWFLSERLILGLFGSGRTVSDMLMLGLSAKIEVKAGEDGLDNCCVKGALIGLSFYLYFLLKSSGSCVNVVDGGVEVV